MTLEELIAETWHKDGGDSVATIKATCGNTSLGGMTIEHTTTGGTASALAALQARNALQSFFVANSRLHIPVSFHQEGLHSGGFFGTIFPEPLLTACSWNASLAQAIGSVLAFEARGAGVDNVWSPVVNMWEDPRFGRYQEGFSPDPTITSHMAAALVLGLQGGASSADEYLPGGFNNSVWSTGKHFVG
jgi:beta-glucosidase-like glycosyl hydrolase